MDLNLKCKVVVVTGAGSGIGLETVKSFVKEGAKVVAVDLNVSALRNFPSEQVIPVEVDLGKAEAGEQVAQAAIDSFGRIDILVNNVGIVPHREGFLSVTDDGWYRVMDVNFMSYVRLSRAAIPYMVKSGSGSIINIASECGRQPDIWLPDYSVTKAAILHLTKVLADEFGPQGIRVNAVSPGSTRTPIWDNPGGFGDDLAAQFGMEKEAAIEHFVKNVRKIPLGRLGAPKEIASVILFLASEVSGYVTGSEYRVNGGSLLAI